MDWHDGSAVLGRLALVSALAALLVATGLLGTTRVTAAQPAPTATSGAVSGPGAVAPSPSPSQSPAPTATPAISATPAPAPAVVVQPTATGRPTRGVDTEPQRDRGADRATVANAHAGRLCPDGGAVADLDGGGDRESNATAGRSYEHPRPAGAADPQAGAHTEWPAGRHPSSAG